MDKRKLYHQYRYIRKARTVYFLVAGVFFLVLGVIGMRSNNLHMIELREKVYMADEKGTDVEKPLRDLQQYVYSHMNTNLSGGNVSIKPPLQLTHSYERLVSREQKKAGKINKKVKKEAEQVCAREFPAAGLNPDRINCVAAYTRDNAVRPKQIPSDLYKFDFISPVWSPDFAGLSLLAGLIFFTISGVRLVTGWWYKRELN